MQNKQLTYRDAGVDIEKAETSLRNLQQVIESTHTPAVLKKLGLFGGFYQFPASNYRRPVLVASTDGVGTKIKVAILANRHQTIGVDLVHHCINDIAVGGAEPLFFLDYFACGHLERGVYQQVISGIAQACQQTGVALIGGETAEMPDMYAPGDYDLAGTIIGVVEESEIIDGSRIQSGDILIGVPSSGLHTNGYTLARKVLLSRYRLDAYIDELSATLGEELLKTHRNYLPLIKSLRKKYTVKGLVHVTGGGIPKNTKRIMPEGLAAQINWGSWPIPPIFQLIQELGRVPDEDMRTTFNLGIGLIAILPSEEVDRVCRDREFQEYFPLWIIGEVLPEK